MPTYHNVMEELVQGEYDRISDSLSCCKCENCRNDIIAYALNLLPPKYVVTRKGAVYSKTYILRSQHLTDILAALAKAAKVVGENPRH